LTSNQRIEAFATLGSQLLKELQNLSVETQGINQIIQSSQFQNPWFTPDNVQRALQSNLMLLNASSLRTWIEPYSQNFERNNNKTVGLILAGNIPMVGFHDVLSCLIAGFNVQIKPSGDDKLLIPYLLNRLIEIEPVFEAKINIVERLANFDLIIATGSNNSSRYFEYYFKNTPHIIRKNRNSAALITGNESKSELEKLGSDLFHYFGLGCRNISKIFFPKNYNYSFFFEAIESFSPITNHYKYNNNYEYNKAIYLVNGDKHLDNGFLLLKEDARFASPLGVVYFEEYDKLNSIGPFLNENKDNIQCIVCEDSVQKLDSFKKLKIPMTGFGTSQSPGLSDYADGVNILDFLKSNS
jgi:hypothetical protein